MPYTVAGGPRHRAGGRLPVSRRVGGARVAHAVSLDTTTVARAAVRALKEDLPTEDLPENEPDWNNAFVAAIREEKERYRGSSDLERLLRITGELLYGKDIHWAMELVQNAEDAGARRMVFVFHNDCVLVWNDGEPFRAADMWAVCSAGHSAKESKIGFFGSNWSGSAGIQGRPSASMTRVSKKLLAVFGGGG